MQALRARIERRGLLSILLLRAAPGVPATLLNHAAGVSRIRPRHFAAGIALGGSPRVAAYAVLGGSLGDPLSLPALLALAGLAVTSAGALTLAWVTRCRLADAPSAG